ncbi:hypothetical protein HK405_000933, partial [Cladochytrium tenue]
QHQQQHRAAPRGPQRTTKTAQKLVVLPPSSSASSAPPAATSTASGPAAPRLSTYSAPFSSSDYTPAASSTLVPRPHQQSTPAPFAPPLPSAKAQHSPSATTATWDDPWLVPSGRDDDSGADLAPADDGPYTTAVARPHPTADDGWPGRTAAERLAKEDRRHLARVTCYCAADAYDLPAASLYLSDRHAVRPVPYDECLYVAYQHRSAVVGSFGRRLSSAKFGSPLGQIRRRPPFSSSTSEPPPHQSSALRSSSSASRLLSLASGGLAYETGSYSRTHSPARSRDRSRFPTDDGADVEDSNGYGARELDDGRAAAWMQRSEIFLFEYGVV